MSGAAARVPALLAALLGVLALAGCAIWGPEGGPGGSGLTGPSAAPPSPVDAVAGPDGVQRVEISAGDDLRFTPSVVRAHPGVIEFVFHNAGSTPHDVRIDIPDAPGASPGPLGTGNLNGGQRATIRVTVEHPGTYPFPCLYHLSSGMQGTLEVR